MIIKSIFRRYERWNPVHPTYGAFWGVGLGIGCGIGWGPGFGPEVIGYVGAGCGAGFSVGITFLGLGIGLPANYLLQAPYNAFVVASRGALDAVQDKSLVGRGSLGRDGWDALRIHIPDVLRNPSAPFSCFDIKTLTGNLIDFSSTKQILAANTKQFTDSIRRRVSKHSFPWDDRGLKN